MNFKAAAFSLRKSFASVGDNESAFCTNSFGLMPPVRSTKLSMSCVFIAFCLRWNLAMICSISAFMASSSVKPLRVSVRVEIVVLESTTTGFIDVTGSRLSYTPTAS